MAIIDSRSDSKFDALIRTNKANSLMAFIMATHNTKDTKDRKKEIATRLRSSYELFRENVKGSNSGAGSYGQGEREVLDQFESHYTMGYEMGIWQDSNFSLTPLALDVANYRITVSEYIGTVFTNLFTYYNVDGKMKYHHFLFEILNKAKIEKIIDKEIPKSLIISTLPISKNIEQGNMVFNYLISSNFFKQIDKDHLSLSDEYKNKSDYLLCKCNLEYSEVDPNDAIKMAKNKESYALYVTKCSEQFGNNKLEFQENCNSGKINSDNNRLTNGENILLYGVPGSGKSHKIDDKIKGARYERVVFHPDYTYSDFVGQIMPKLKESETGEEKLSYEFVPGPFTKALDYADKHLEEMHYLVIEEINRGNSAAIFGDIFQLLDRNQDGSGKYSITNFDIGREVFKDEQAEIKLPSNLSILATMNTSDQNVFTLDTAFQRRWKMEYVENDINKANHASSLIEGSKIKWGQFANAINAEIVSYNAGLSSSEDKQLGAYFIQETELKSDVFPEKALKYLWDDAFKLERDRIFNDEIKSIGDLITTYKNENTAKRDPIKGVLKEEVYKRMMDMTANSAEEASNETEKFQYEDMPLEEN